MTSPKLKLFQSIGLALALVCAAQPVSAQSTGAAAAPQQTSPTSTMSNDSSDYRLGAGDKIRVIVFGEPDLSNEFVVSSEGKVSLPLIGDQVAGGGTASELQTRIAAALSNGYLLNPKVNVEVLTFRPFYILGEVNKPGEYPYESGMTAGRAVATASGYTYRANKKKVFIKHAGQAAEVEEPMTDPVTIQPGDTIRIPERYF